MKTETAILRSLLVALAVFSNVNSQLSTALAQVTANNSSPSSEAAKIQARRVKALNDALGEFQNNNDQESANFVASILTAVNEPGGQAPNALAADMQRMKSQVRGLVRRGASESAGILNHAQIMSFYSFDFPGRPAHPHQKTGGAPGPGGLVLYLPFDKPDLDGVVHDESGAGNDGMVYGAQWVAEGKFGGAYHFSVTNFEDRIVVPNSDLLNAENITVAAWIKSPRNTGCYERILDKDFYHGFSLSLSGQWDNRAERGRLLWETGNGNVMGRGADDNRWHHVAAIYDGRMVRCYVDGVESDHQARKGGPMSKSGWDLCIGNSVVNYGWGELLAFDGWIDEVRVYNRALSDAEIKLLAAATRAGTDVLSPAADATSKGDPAERLKKLKSLYDQGLINKDDYDKKVKEIMDSL